MILYTFHTKQTNTWHTVFARSVLYLCLHIETTQIYIIHSCVYAYGCTMCRMYNVHCTCFCWAVSDFIIYFFATIWIEDIPPCVCVCACFHALSHCRLFRYWQKKRKRHVIIILINKTIYDKRKKQPHTNICQLLKYFAYTNDSYLFWVHKHDTKKNAAVQFFGCFFFFFCFSFGNSSSAVSHVFVFVFYSVIIRLQRFRLVFFLLSYIWFFQYLSLDFIIVFRGHTHLVFDTLDCFYWRTNKTNTNVNSIYDEFVTWNWLKWSKENEIFFFV